MTYATAEIPSAAGSSRVLQWLDTARIAAPARDRIARPGPVIRARRAPQRLDRRARADRSSLSALGVRYESRSIAARSRCAGCSTAVPRIDEDIVHLRMAGERREPQRHLRGP